MDLTIQDHDNAEGNLVDWWTAEDSKQFSALTTALANQYSARSLYLELC
jgi:predicted metalloendopeptidase